MNNSLVQCEGREGGGPRLVYVKRKKEARSTPRKGKEEGDHDLY